MPVLKSYHESLSLRLSPSRRRDAGGPSEVTDTDDNTSLRRLRLPAGAAGAPARRLLQVNLNLQLEPGESLRPQPGPRLPVAAGPLAPGRPGPRASESESLAGRPTAAGAQAHWQAQWQPPGVTVTGRGGGARAGQAQREPRLRAGHRRG